MVSVQAARPPPTPRLLTGARFMQGDHACAEGALAGGLDFFAGSLGLGFLLSGLLRRFRLCPLAGLSFGHVFVAFPNCFVEL